mgnify:CR=1 FL=1
MTLPSGIIPARAGFTSVSLTACRIRRDHPRSRGVYLPDMALAPCHVGSSPLARGLRQRQGSGAAGRGIIPARAGFTLRACRREGRFPDHPRSRGVYRAGRATRAVHRGSSPLARGLRDRQVLVCHCVGIIPARAGFTHSVACTRRTPEDHPRSRGVYTATASRATGVVGSSPLARGLRPLARGSKNLGGIIPARAGFTE